MTTSAKLARDSHSKSSYDQIHGTFAPAKCTGISHENYDPRKFNSKVSYEIFDEVFKEAPPVEEIVTPARLHFAFETSSIYEALHIDTMTLFLEIVGLAMGF